MVSAVDGAADCGITDSPEDCFIALSMLFASAAEPDTASTAALDMPPVIDISFPAFASCIRILSAMVTKVFESVSAGSKPFSTISL